MQTQTQSFNQTHFIKLPYSIITLSLTQNRYILPLYLYSGINCNIYNDYQIDTNLAHIVESFCPNEDSRKGNYQKFTQALHTLSSPELPILSEDTDSPFSLITKTNRLLYYYNPSSQKTDWVKFTFEEYYTLLSVPYKLPSSSKKINLVELINFYAYLKLNTAKHSNLYIATINKIAKDLSLGSRTITYYASILSALNLINFTKGHISKASEWKIIQTP